MNYIKNNRVLLLVIAALLMVNIGLLYYGTWNKKGKQNSKRQENKDIREHVKMKLQNEVGFNEVQLGRYDELRTKHFEGLKPMFEELKIAKDSFFNLLYRPELSDSVVSFYAQKVCDKQQAIDMKMLRHFRSLKELATDTQKPKMDSFLQKITRKMSGGGRRGPGPEKGKDKK